MSLARVVITAVIVEGRSKSEVARDYGVSRVWVQRLVHRYRREGPAAFEPRSMAAPPVTTAPTAAGAGPPPSARPGRRHRPGARRSGRGGT